MPVQIRLPEIFMEGNDMNFKFSTIPLTEVNYLTYADKELLAKRIQRAEAQLIIDAHELEDAARQLQEQARNFRERANLLLSAYCDVWKSPPDDEEA